MTTNKKLYKDFAYENNMGEDKVLRHKIRSREELNDWTNALFFKGFKVSEANPRINRDQPIKYIHLLPFGEKPLRGYSSATARITQENTGVYIEAIHVGNPNFRRENEAFSEVWGNMTGQPYRFSRQ